MTVNEAQSTAAWSWFSFGPVSRWKVTSSGKKLAIKLIICQRHDKPNFSQLLIESCVADENMLDTATSASDNNHQHKATFTLLRCLAAEVDATHQFIDDFVSIDPRHVQPMLTRYCRHLGLLHTAETNCYHSNLQDITQGWGPRGLSLTSRTPRGQKIVALASTRSGLGLGLDALSSRVWPPFTCSLFSQYNNCSGLMFCHRSIHVQCWT